VGNDYFTSGTCDHGSPGIIFRNSISSISAGVYPSCWAKTSLTDMGNEELQMKHIVLTSIPKKMDLNPTRQKPYHQSQSGFHRAVANSEMRTYSCSPNPIQIKQCRPCCTMSRLPVFFHPLLLSCPTSKCCIVPLRYPILGFHFSSADAWLHTLDVSCTCAI